MNPGECHLCGKVWYGDGPCPECFNNPIVAYRSVSMTERSAKHLDRLLDEAATRIRIKYTQGNLEHGGDLLDKGLIGLVDEAVNEAVDQLVYLLTLREKLG